RSAVADSQSQRCWFCASRLSRHRSFPGRRSHPVRSVRKRKLPELETAQSFIAALVGRTSEVPWLGRELLALLVVIVVVRYDQIAKRLGGIPGHSIEFAGNSDTVLDLKEFCRIFGLQAELGIDAAHLRNVLLQQKILPALNFDGHVVAATLQKECHCGVLRQPCPSNAAKTKPSIAPSPFKSTAAKSPCRLTTETSVPNGSTFCTSNSVPGPARSRRPARAFTTRRGLITG